MSIVSICHCLGRKFLKFRLALVNFVLFTIGFLTVLQILVENNDLASSGKFSGVPRISHQKNSSEETIGYDKEQSCQFPILDPFDASILPYVKHPYPILCQRVQPEFTHVEEGDVLRVDENLAKKHLFKNVTYRSILRKNESHIYYGKWQEWNISMHSTMNLKTPVEIVGDYVFDARKKHEENLPLKKYRNLHATVRVPSDENDTDFRRPEEDALKNTTPPLNVFIFGIDSLSRSNFIRNLPLTYDVLKNRMGSIDMRGYTKIDDNTFPNILAVLTGHKVTIHGSELQGHFQHDHVDHYPFIWKNFSALGYTTGLAEEQPGVLSYKAKGFRKPPVHWYMRPFGVALEKSPVKKYSSPYCVGNRAESTVILDTISRFLQERQRFARPYFLFSFLWKLSHDKTNDVQMIDNALAAFFGRLFDRGYLNNTLLFVMSDHGNRFDTIRRTLIGRYEERMPYLSVYLPARFKARFPSVTENLRRNVWRLTCQFDVYETLVDALLKHYGGDRDTFKNRGRSLFSEISKSRTCEDAQIAPHFCVCQKEEQLDVNLPHVQKAARFALDKINRHILAAHKRLCAKLHLKDVISAQKYKASNNVLYAIRWHFDELLQDKNVTAIVSHLRVTFSTSPNDGVYEALVQYYADEKEERNFNATRVDLSRINAYGTDGNCVSAIDRTLEKFCYCKKTWFS